MKKTVLSLVFFLILSCQKESTSLKITLKEKSGYGHFNPGNAILFPSQDSIYYSSVPNNVKEYVVRRFYIDKNQKMFDDYHTGNIKKDKLIHEITEKSIDTLSLSQKNIDNDILLLIGTDDNNDRVIIIDSDNDESFKNEKIFNFKYPLSKKQQDSIEPFLKELATDYDVFLNGNITKQTTTLKPSPYKGSLGINLSSDKEIEKDYYLFVSIPKYKKGEAIINESNYYVEIANGFSTPIYDNDNTEILIYESDYKDFLDNNISISYNIGDVFNASGKDYEIKGISKLGDELLLEFLKDNDKPKGVTDGFYPPTFKSYKLDGAPFKLDNYKGNYVLIDFWGTWCAPCIKAIPELKKTNNLLAKSKNFKLISVAFDSDRKNVIKYTENQEMNWEHVFVDNTKRDENSIVEKFKISSFPSTILINPNGKIIARNITFKEIRNIVLNNAL